MADAIASLRASGITPTYDLQARTLRTDAPAAVTVTIDRHH